MAPPPEKPVFPTYLLPSLSFPLRRSSTSTTSETHAHAVPYLSHSPTSSADSSPSSSPPNSVSLLHAALHSLPSAQLHRRRTDRLHTLQPSILRCNKCASDIAFTSQIVSKGFTGRHGRAYLVEALPGDDGKLNGKLCNTKIGRIATRELLTGTHVVADVSCVICCTVLGWKYVDAKEPAQMYKIGKFILETKRVVVRDGWELERVEILGEEAHRGEGEQENMVVFDSEDDDECEELFAGVWDAATVAKRRGKRVSGKRKAISDI